MSEVLEAFAMGTAHTTNDPKCPFCPKKKNDQHYTTHGGAENDGGTLGSLVDDPKKFGTSIEGDARPKDGKQGKDGRPNQAFAETEPLKGVKGKDKDWKFQCHHAISGNQCLKGDPVETFIKEGDQVKFDTGYSVNNPQNGIWLPSYPEDENWPSDAAKKFDLAKVAMKKFTRQFHLGHHNISVDVDGIDTKTDEKYTDYVKGQLKDLHVVISKWEAHCPEEDAEKKHLGNARIHMMLDHVSDHIAKKLKGSPGKWTIFVSRHARDFTIKTRKPATKLDFE
jgi:hypothetical protein